MCVRTFPQYLDREGDPVRPTETMKPCDIQTRKPFNELFPIDDETLKAIKSSMEDNRGYDTNYPVIIWQEENVLIDGHTRVRAATECGYDVVAIKMSFPNEDEALKYAIHAQLVRRNLDDADKLNLVMRIHDRNRKGSGGDRRSAEAKSKASNDALDSGSGKASVETAHILGLSPTMVERALKVASNEKEKRRVLSRKSSIYRAWVRLTKGSPEAKESQSPKKFNKNSTMIEWARYSWNPVWGCKTGCPYCYARDWAVRNSKDFADVKFHGERLTIPTNMGEPTGDGPGDDKVFVCSMSDLFAPYVMEKEKEREKKKERTWHEQILKAVRESPAWTFIFLTKFPENLPRDGWPDNAWVGTTVDCQTRVEGAVKAFRKITAPVKFVSCEPLVEPITFHGELGVFDWIILGGQSPANGKEGRQPEWSVVESLLKEAKEAKDAKDGRPKEVPVYIKPNLTVRPKCYPEARVMEPAIQESDNQAENNGDTIDDYVEKTDELFHEKRAVG
jgi:protein gp37